MTTLVLVMTLSMQAETSPQRGECWTEPLKLSLGELAAMGTIAETVVKHHCYATRVVRMNQPLGMGMVVGETKLLRFSLAGEELEFGLNVMLQPGGMRDPDLLYVTPTLKLPEKWQRQIDKATYPALIIGGSAVLGNVIYQLLK